MQQCTSLHVLTACQFKSEATVITFLECMPVTITDADPIVVLMMHHESTAQRWAPGTLLHAPSVAACTAQGAQVYPACTMHHSMRKDLWHVTAHHIMPKHASTIKHHAVLQRGRGKAAGHCT